MLEPSGWAPPVRTDEPAAADGGHTAMEIAPPPEVDADTEDAELEHPLFLSRIPTDEEFDTNPALGALAALIDEAAAEAQVEDAEPHSDADADASAATEPGALEDQTKDRSGSGPDSPGAPTDRPSARRPVKLSPHQRDQRAQRQQRLGMIAPYQRRLLDRAVPLPSRTPRHKQISLGVVQIQLALM